ncbi:unnamed protein product, partial [Urochloa humidicola]
VYWPPPRLAGHLCLAGRLHAKLHYPPQLRLHYTPLDGQKWQKAQEPRGVFSAPPPLLAPLSGE